MKSIEIEVKFKVVDGEALESKLVAAGFHKVTARTFERNLLYDTADRQLRAKGEILRIRQYGPKWVVTHKRIPPDTSPEARHKQRIETETEVEDGEAMATIFERLGLQTAFLYEKWRTEWADDTGHCVLDDTPIGVFAELEGPTDWIDGTSDKLGIAREDLLTLSYGRLFDMWKERTGSAESELTFAAIPAKDAG